jgi:hypothetical protein
MGSGTVEAVADRRIRCFADLWHAGVTRTGARSSLKTAPSGGQIVTPPALYVPQPLEIPSFSHPTTKKP